jgi:hypothetical protein
MLRRSLTIFASALALTAIAAPAPAATTYQTVTLTVPVTIASMPIGTTANVSCFAGQFTGQVVTLPNYFAMTIVPVTTQPGTGFVSYSGPPIVVVLKPPPGAQSAMVTGVQVRCQVNLSPNTTPINPTRSTRDTSPVTLQ